MVAALFVDPKGVYANLPDVEVWDEARDARQYAGPWPVVAHPPCARWSIMGLCRGYGDGNDGGCFQAALEAVRSFGGVLEHPRFTLAWKAFGLPRPSSSGWTRSLLDDGWTCEVDQRLYGHAIRKPTWLYYVGPAPPPLLWGTGERGAKTVARGFGGGRSHLVAATPVAFRDELLAMARAARALTLTPPLDETPAPRERP